MRDTQRQCLHYQQARWFGDGAKDTAYGGGVQMVTRMGTEAGKTLYGKRKNTVETTFGCIKDTMGFRNPKMRGLAGVQIEWQLGCSAWNLKRTFNLSGCILF